jgi:signal transduction histidine kinase
MSKDHKTKHKPKVAFHGRLPFITKLRLFIIFLVLGFSLFFLTFFTYHARNMNMKELKKDGMLLSQDLAWGSELGVLANDSRYLAHPLEHHHEREEMVYSMIYDKEGKLLARKSKFSIDIALPEKAFEGLEIGEIKSNIRKFNRFDVYEFILPISSLEIDKATEPLISGPEDELPRSEKFLPPPKNKNRGKGKEHIIGYARVGFSLARVEEDTNQIIKIGLVVTGIFLVAGILISYFMAKILTRPINTLTDGVKSIIGGNLKQQIQIQTKDEFADLAQAFNEMSNRLMKRMEEIRQKNEELESFAHTVSHDLKTPLISIQGFSSILKKKYGSGLGEKGKFYLERIQKNVEKMDRLIHDLLKLSRIGRVKKIVEPVECEKVIREISDELQHRIKEKNICLLIAQGLPVVYGNRTHIYQIFSNLIGNAIKFIGDNSEPKIEITFQRENDYYRFGVRDNGIGIEEQYFDKIFGMFQRLGENAEGTGVGLAIVKRLVKIEGGEVMLESEPGKGTTFYVTLPAEMYQQI